MATIKTQLVDGITRILTKTTEDVQRVSCSCCQEETTCCVYPAICNRAPESIEFFGQILTGVGTTFGDTTNGVALENGAWAIYRNGNRSERECLGIALPEASASISAILATTYFLSIDQYTADLSFFGSIPAVTDEALFGETINQCGWGGGVNEMTQDFDEGFSLLFNPANCRWELANGPLGFLYAYREDDSPIGSYTVSASGIDSVVIS